MLWTHWGDERSQSFGHIRYNPRQHKQSTVDGATATLFHSWVRSLPSSYAVCVEELDEGRLRLPFPKRMAMGDETREMSSTRTRNGVMII